MNKSVRSFHRFRGISFVGNYLPRQCGIATFTHDLAEAVAVQAGDGQAVSVCAMNDKQDGYDYPDRVRFEVRQEKLGDYLRLADFLNFTSIDAVSLQHEYGIFGGEEGSHILTALRDLQRPFAVTCHTVLKDPKPMQREVFTEITARARKVVVMSAKAFQFLEETYNVPKEKIALIPHGIHDVPFIDPSYHKDKFGLEGRKMLLTFGLLSRNKGIENVIKALPTIVERHPNTTYVILGATHPAILQLEGEAYRLELQRLVRKLGLEEHVLFHSRFVDLDELLEYIGACDVFVTPYRNLDQITSGALSYAMGAGKAVISTPYWHAEELLGEGRGRLVPIDDVTALSQEIHNLFVDDVALSAMRKRAYLYCRSMIWPSVARSYLDLFDEIRRYEPIAVPVHTSMTRLISSTNLPALKLDHLLRLSDDTGLAHHARRALPDWRYGYWLKDAAAGLVVTSKFHRLFSNNNAVQLSERYLGFLQHLLEGYDNVVGRLDYARRPKEIASGEDLGKAVWALGYAVSMGPKLSISGANESFNQLVPEIEIDDFKGIAYAALGAANYLERFPGASGVRRYLSAHAKELSRRCRAKGWIDSWDGQDFGVAVQAIAVAARVLDSSELKEQAIVLGRELTKSTSNGTMFLKRGHNQEGEELPIIAMSFIEAVGAIYYLQPDRELLEVMRSAANWFLGVNRRDEVLYDFSSGGCYDAISAGGVNQNQGTESTLAFLMAFLTLHELSNIKDEQED